MIVDVHLIPARGEWDAHLEGALAAEESGFATVWVADHLSGAVFGGDSMLECFTQLGALATATTTVGLGTLVVNVNNRAPGLLAVAAASVQHISGGRFVLGLGAGASPESPFAGEQHAVGRPPAASMSERHDNVVEALSMLDAQWASDRSALFLGFPRAEPAPPVILGVNSRRLATVAGRRTNGVNVRWNHPDRTGIVEAACTARSGRTGWWTTSVWAPWDETLCDPEHPLRLELAADGVDRLVLMWSAAPDPTEIERGGRRLRGDLP